MTRGPDFIIIGAMKCATSTLHEQLAAQDGFFLTDPKEPNFFSDDAVHRRGLDWYLRLFEGAPAAALCGESSTHYTKRPTHPRTVERLRRDRPDVRRFVYVMRHPVDRLVSHYVHEWTQRVVDGPIDAAVEALPEMVDYGCYDMQLEPWLDAYGPRQVLPVFFERLVAHPQEQLERVARFLGHEGPVTWRDDLGPRNASARRERRSAVREVIARVPGARTLLHGLVPAATWERCKARWWRMPARPELSAEVRRQVEAVFDADLARLGRRLGVRLDCATWTEAVDRPDWTWTTGKGVAA